MPDDNLRSICLESIERYALWVKTDAESIERYSKMLKSMPKYDTRAVATMVDAANALESALSSVRLLHDALESLKRDDGP